MNSINQDNFTDSKTYFVSFMSAYVLSENYRQRKRTRGLKMDEKCVITTWLFKTDLSNMNAGEGSTNLKELKTYDNGLPYISGQSVRHALRKAIKRENPQALNVLLSFHVVILMNAGCAICLVIYCLKKVQKDGSQLKHHLQWANP